MCGLVITFASVKPAIFITIFFLLAKPVMPVLEYVVNYDYIATELCENKARPEMHCNGKCHLMKELAKASENEKQDGKPSLQHAYEVLFITPLPVFDFNSCVVANPVALDRYENNYSHLYTSASLRPPTVYYS